ncbi:MAG: methyltransferase domain-containing protein [Candidatus Tectomicrobia bacterium]|nr:methyltransferase domain-containing protein [Candidatus Tectomicrobia bacterium]
MRVLFLVPYPTEGASNRLRIEQYLPYLERHGVKGDVRPFLSRRLYWILYREGYFLEKWVRLAASLVRRIFILLRANRYDVVVIHRRILPFWLPWAGYFLRRIRRPVVYDFDDAVFLSDTRGGLAKIASWLGQPKQVAEILRASASVIAGNESLREYALQFNGDVHLLPTPVDDETYRPPDKPDDRRPLVIGWIGSHTTSPYLRQLDDAFRRLLERFPQLEIHVVGGRYDLPGDGSRVRNIPWRLDGEYEALCRFDVGVMPLNDDEWERYKCGFKALLYMSMGIPVVCSPVGVNNQIVRDGVNGFVARTTEEWVERIGRLLGDAALRRRVGREGRRTVEDRYSVRGNAPAFLSILDRAASAAARADSQRFQRLQRATQRSFDFQWTQFPDMVPANEGHFLNYIHPLKPDFFRGKRVLDAACGFGRHAYYAAGYGTRHMVGMDFSNAIFSAREVNRNRPNVSLVKGDIYQLPFRRGAFDCIYSLGALHHLPDPEGGFLALLDYLKPGGAIAVWVYSKKRRFMNRVLEGVRFVTRNIPFATLKKICFLCACVDYFCFILPYKPLRGIPFLEKRMLPRIKLYAKFPFWVNYADWFDRLSAPVRYYFNREDLGDWARRAGLVNVIISPTGEYGWRLYGERAPAAQAEPVGDRVAVG